MQRILVVCGTVLLTVLVWWLWSRETVTNNITPEAPIEENTIVNIVDYEGIAPDSTWVPPTITYDTYQSIHGALPPSLEGTRVPFNLLIDENGELIVNESLRRLFDYFFTTNGEEPLEIIVARIKELITTHLPEIAQGSALEILQQYFELKQAEIELARQMDFEFKASGERPSLIEIRRVLRDLRASNLDADVYAAFFGVENQRDDYTLNRLEIQGDASLTDEERQTALETIEEYLPPADREHMESEREAQQVYQDVKNAKAEGATEAEVFHLREQVFGVEAAQRYADADSKQASWDNRITTYRAQREDILNATGLTEDDKTNQIGQLRQQHFEGTELKRISVIDRMMDSEE
ncbi:hypothetical protein A9Q81_20840 [Gammaproteobacteria bacterium 42_54_T18]|nr:hypothetical protein A9Q81_20840 [Gammaproteobacteria bacterium 42_54_T18]